MHGDLVPFDVLQDPVVGGGRAPDIVLGLQSVDRYHDLKAPESDPLGGDRPHGTGHELRVNIAFRELGKDLAKLAISHERLAADDRDVKRLVAIDHRHEAADQFVALVVGEAAKRHATAEMFVAVRVTARAPQWTFASDFDRKIGTMPGQDAAPCLDDFARADGFSAHVAPIMIVICTTGDSKRPNARYPVVHMPPDLQLPRIVRRRSRVHGWGVFAKEPINKNTRIVSYEGELIDHRESLKRETQLSGTR